MTPGQGDKAETRVVHARLPAHKSVLQAADALKGILEAAPATAEEGNKLPVSVLHVADKAEAEAAQAVLRFMYEGVLPGSASAQLLARMCTVASRWGAAACADAFFSTLNSVKFCHLEDRALVEVLELLRPAAPLTGQRKWMEQQLCRVFGDVHLLLTTPAKLELFVRLPFDGVLAWAGSAGLVVDSENSVVVALDCWVRLGLGKSCSKEHLLQLSSLVRAKHLTPEYLAKVPTLSWWLHGGEQAMQLAAALKGADDGSVTVEDLPAAWLSAPRPQLDADVLRQRTTVQWAVPRKDLALAPGLSAALTSLPVYAAGVGARLQLSVAATGKGSTTFTVQWDACAYSPPGGALPVVEAAVPLVINSFTLTRAVPGEESVTVAADSSGSEAGASLLRCCRLRC